MKMVPEWDEDIAEDNGTQHGRERREVVISEIAGLLSASGKVNNASKLRASLIHNERRFSCAIGCGVAIPHARCMQSRNLVMGFARVGNDGIDFDAPDTEKVKLFIAMTAPPYDDKLYLKVYKAIAEAFLHTDVKKRLLEASEPGEIIRTFNEYFG